MADRPLLAMPRPARRAPRPGRPPIENISSADPCRQSGRLGPKFEQLNRTLSNPDALGEFRDDPSAIVSERALVFEVASEVVDFYRAVRGVSSLEFLDEDEGDAAPDEDFLRSGHERLSNGGQARSAPLLFYDSEPIGAQGTRQTVAEISTQRGTWLRAHGHGATYSGISRMSGLGDQMTA